MDKVYKHQDIEQKWYELWEKRGYFTPKKDPTKRPFTIILPPPNANADLHAGHAMYVVEDIMIRYHRMKGDATLWLPGADHAGFETQYVFEKKLSREEKSRFDFDRETLYQMIWDFVQKNRGNMETQLRRLGFSLDWTKNTFTLDPKIIAIVYKTFKKLYDDGLVYRGLRLVNYCTKCGTGFSDLEVNYVERNDPLYYMKYGPFTIATVRPETKFRDTALAVNPKDKRYKQYIGKIFDIQGLLGKVKMTIIPDASVDPKFGTGIMKVTPAHDPHDFELGKKFSLPVTPIIDFKGRMDFSWFIEKKDVDAKYLERAKKYHGQKVAAARALMVEDLKADGLLIRVNEKYTHRIGVCYKSGTVIEPLPMTQWYIKVKPLTEKAKAAIKKKDIQFVPKRFEKTAMGWLTNFHDWNISRQIVWGIRIPAWKCMECSSEENWIVTTGEKPEKCPKCEETKLEQDTDTFDTWFSSGQWPFATLQSNSDFNYFYPTSVMETGYDILPWWVCRMIMLGIYMTDDVPFRTVYLHGLVRDSKGQKMSKSRGNVINPIIMTDQYGADSLRMALIFGAAPGNDLSLSEDKIRGMRNFSNKLWNIGRFIKMNIDAFKEQNLEIEVFDPAHLRQKLNPHDKKILSQLGMLERGVTKQIEDYRFDKAAERLYKFIWHTFADRYIEGSKKRLAEKETLQLSILIHVYTTSLKLLHPFMPFITEEINKQLISESQPLIISPWPVI
ncbi:valine--tRNA ligase [Candidatus Gottesmanbacteria bacterium RIFCSPHIGHO2_01_FULL_39_10]|uniref:Valine--tRNA ligase n=1 Tax=Candidatus Gottesmanbacteria bacterium RIFCSPHIGHO2_01_FULL_39_10 TaxID=1798375 RepID=A0A1F5ZPY0_9BACT|nr:MAG: valine--tRNA ligase [Candidatus Gottesmanbacteria bacterium RIFCSPHIGHO2_01_FULL_39_10]